MLGHENQVVEHGYVAQGELDRVAGDAGPVSLDVTVNGLLADAQDAAGEVEQDLQDAPALGGAVAVVDNDLGRVFDERDDQLDVRDGVDGVQPDPRGNGLAGA